MGDVAAHARFSPSGASRWMTCPGSIALTRDIPNPGSEYSAEGTAAHTLASRALEYGHPAAFWLGEQIQVEGRVFTVDNDMADHVQAYVDDVLRRVAGGTLLVEQRVGFSEAIGVEAQFGTADAIILSADGAHAIVEDLKYGRGVQVYATENKQLMTYAVAVLETFETIMEGVENITLVVAQPRLDHYDEWTVSVERLREHAAALRLAERGRVLLLPRQADVRSLAPARIASRVQRFRGARRRRSGSGHGGARAQHRETRCALR